MYTDQIHTQTNRLNTFSASLVLTIVTVLLAISLANLTWQLIPEVTAPAPPKQARQTIEPAASAVDFVQLATLQLFGMPSVAQPSDAPIPPTELTAVDWRRVGLMVSGIYFSTDRATSRALIQSSNGAERVFHEGETVQNGVLLTEIRPSAIVLRNGDSTHEMHLTSDAMKSLATARTR